MKSFLPLLMTGVMSLFLFTTFVFGQDKTSAKIIENGLANHEVLVSGQSSQVSRANITEFPWFEGFDGGALPESWQNNVIAGEGWSFFTSPFSHTVTYYFGDLERESMLITPMLDLSGLETVTFGINHRIYAYGAGWTQQILISNDGVNWDVLVEYTEGFDPDDYQYDEFDITPSKAGEQVYLAFSVDYPLLGDYYEVVWEIESVTVFSPIPTYNVNFVVEDDGGIALNDAVVTLNGVTNAASDYLFEEIEAGIYDYTVELNGYTTETGQLTVVDQDVEETVVLSQPMIISEFPWFEGFDGGLPEGWQNVVNEGNGFDFALNPYSHTYIYYFGDLQRNAMLVTPLLNLSGMETVTLGIFHRIYAYGTGWTNKILISNDGVNWETVAEFTEGFDPDINLYMEFDITPSKAGEQVYLAFEANYPFLTDYYEAVWEIVDIDVFEPIPTYKVNFVVEDDGGIALNDALVTFNGVTNAAGDYLFEEIEAGTYEYSVAYDGYITVEGQINVVDQDVEETVVLLTGQYVELLEGWSLISSYITPNNLSLWEIFADQVEDETMVILLGNAGIFWPGYNINTMGDWNTQQGYKVKMNAFDMAGIAGVMVEDKVVQLPAGISYLPVLSDEPVIAVDIFNQLGENLIYAFDLVDGLVYWPEGGIFTLQVLVPGRAYTLGIDTPGEVSFADIDGIINQPKPFVQTLPAYCPSFIKTGSTHIISIFGDALENVINPGDVVAAFNTLDQCVGAVQYVGGSENLALVVYGDDQTSADLDGMNDGERIELKLIQASSQEILDIVPAWNVTMPNSGYFTENGLSGISSIKLSPLGISDQESISVSFYPNPVRDILNINMQGCDAATVVILDNLGREVWEGEINRNVTSCNISALPQGVFFVKITSGKNILNVSKLIIE